MKECEKISRNYDVRKENSHELRKKKKFEI